MVRWHSGKHRSAVANQLEVSDSNSAEIEFNLDQFLNGFETQILRLACC